MKIEDMLLTYKYIVTFYIPYKLYVLFKKNGNIKSIIEQEINKNMSDRHRKSLQIKKITEDLFLITIKVKEFSVYQKIKEIFMSDYELLPPWIAFPDMFQGCPRWNQGYEEDYCCNHWIPYWNSMNEKERNMYCIKHKASKEWLEWLNKYLFENI